MKYEVLTIAEYVNEIPRERKQIITRIIALIRNYFPNVKSSMKYNMPTFNGVCSVASQKHYISIYIHQTDVLEKYRNELGNLNVGKSCIRFKNDEDFPEFTLEKIFREIKLKE